MPPIALAFTFPEMLAAQEIELAKWEQWFLNQPASLLDLHVDMAKAEDLRSVLFHIFIVEVAYGEPLNDLHHPDVPIADVDTIPRESFAELFALHHRGFALLKRWAEHTTPEDAAKIFTRGKYRVSKKKCFIQAMEHTMRHFAQLAVALRQAGHPTDWMHDFIVNPSML